MLARISPSGFLVVCTLTYAMLVAMYLSTQKRSQNSCLLLLWNDRTVMSATK